jgi:hypothetical protein
MSSAIWTLIDHHPSAYLSIREILSTQDDEQERQSAKSPDRIWNWSF